VSFIGGCSRKSSRTSFSSVWIRSGPIILVTRVYAENEPTIDAIAAEGVRFHTCYSVSGWTLPSMATIMTGTYPKDHGRPTFTGRWPELPTLAGTLRRAGYDTRAYVSHVFLKPIYGFGDGFGSFDFSVLDVGHPTTSRRDGSSRTS